MTLRCSFMTSSYLRTSLRISALRPSTVFWARSMALVTILASMGTSSGRARVMTQLHGAGGEQPHQLVLERQEEPALAGVALAPERPRSWLSMRRLSWRSLPST
jgi:hypothetical protein